MPAAGSINSSLVELRGWQGFGVGGMELVGGGGGAGEGAVGFFVEAGGNGFDGVPTPMTCEFI